jgi:signal transduction histidine kinase
VFSDNGRGFDLNLVKDKIFGLHQKFGTNEDSKGIGLYLVHSNISSMGGSISIDSTPGQGSTFVITFAGEN